MEINPAIAAMKYAVDALDSIAEQVTIPKGTTAHEQLREVVALADRAAKLRAELAELRARVSGVPRTSEYYFAMRDAHLAHDSKAYFAARNDNLDTRENRQFFEAGFTRGFAAGEKVYAGTIASVPEAVAKDAEIDIDSLACALAIVDGYDPKDPEDELWHVHWSGGAAPEPEGDLYSIEYRRRAYRVIAAIKSNKTGDEQ